MHNLSYKEYEQQCIKMKAQNQVYLQMFQEDLTATGLSQKTIDRHLSNMDFYLNEYLVREELATMEQGLRKVSDFLGDFFIRKCMWSNPSTIKTTAASIKKFYKSMNDHKKVGRLEYEILCDTIQRNIDEWIADCAAYNNPESPNPF